MSNMFYKPSIKGFTPEAINGIRPLFDQLDKDHNGSLNVHETKKLFKHTNIDELLAPIAFEICDTNKSGTITFNEFIPFFKLLLEMEKDPSIIYRNLFEKYDIDKNGYLDKEEAKKFTRHFVNPDQYSDEIFFQVFDDLDENKDGKLSFEELLALMNNE